MEMKTLGTVATYINGRAFKPSEWEKAGMPIIRIQNLTSENAPYNYSKGIFEEKYIVHNGDLLFAWSASLGAHIWKGQDAWLNQHIFKVLPKEGIDRDYLYYFLLAVVAELYAKTHGSGMVHITKAPFMNTPIPVPSLPEQERIVARIEELFSQLDAGVETLKKTKAQLAVYRQAVLKEAFAVCKEYVAIESVTQHVTDGDHMPPPKADNGIPFIMISNIKENAISWGNTAFVGRDYYDSIEPKRKPQNGDVLYTVTGSYGIPVLVDFNKEFCFQRHIALLRPNDAIEQKYLYYSLMEPSVYAQATKGATGTAQKTVGLGILRKIEIPFIENHSDQLRIVEAIESRLSVCDSIEQTVDTALQQAEAMRQSILKEAFEGTL
jgi:type I restriction enzyme S subunit